MTRTTIAFLLCFAMALCATSSLAGPLNTTGNSAVYVDGLSNTWRGSTSFSQTEVSGTLAGFVDWAVYAPGDFPAFSGYTPTPGEFVYAYQLYVLDNLGETNVAATSMFITLLDGHPADNIGSFTGTVSFGSITGVSVGFNAIVADDSAQWYFVPSPIAPGSNSVGLAFSSPNPPIIDEGSVLDGGIVSTVFPLPTSGAVPIPEPGTLTLGALGLAACALLLLRRRIGKD